MNKNLYVITPIFNPFGFKSRARLYKSFAKHMAESGAILFTIEAAFGHEPFEVTDPANPMHVQLRTNQILWHKERLINIAYERLKHVVPDMQYVGWFDADIIMANPDWVSESTHQLSHLCVIQPFSEAINLNAKGEYMWNCPASFKAFIEERGFHQYPPLPIAKTYKGHPGLAWCATRAAFDAMGGLYDACVSGSADTVMSNALKGDIAAYLPDSPSPAMLAHMTAWGERAQKFVRGRIGFARGVALHNWHGKSTDRGYQKRWSILSFHRFDPEVDIVPDSQGLYKWAGNKPQLEDDIRLSLGSRNEDEI